MCVCISWVTGPTGPRARPHPVARVLWTPGHRCLDAIERLREKGISVGLVNKCTLNMVDDEMMAMIGKVLPYSRSL